MHFLQRFNFVPSQLPEKLRWNGSDAPGLHTYQAPSRKVGPTKASEHLLTWARRRHAPPAYVMRPNLESASLFQEPQEMFFVGSLPPAALSPETRSRNRALQRKKMPGACGCAWRVKDEELPEFSERLNAAMQGAAQEVVIPEPGSRGSITKRKSQLFNYLDTENRWYPNKGWGAALEWGVAKASKRTSQSRVSQVVSQLVASQRLSKANQDSEGSKESVVPENPSEDVSKTDRAGSKDSFVSETDREGSKESAPNKQTQDPSEDVSKSDPVESQTSAENAPENPYED